MKKGDVSKNKRVHHRNSICLFRFFLPLRRHRYIRRLQFFCHHQLIQPLHFLHQQRTHFLIIPKAPGGVGRTSKVIYSRARTNAAESCCRWHTAYHPPSGEMSILPALNNRWLSQRLCWQWAERAVASHIMTFITFLAKYTDIMLWR